MARGDTQPGLTPSLLDRFIDPAFQNEAPRAASAWPRPSTWCAATSKTCSTPASPATASRRGSRRCPRSLVAFGMPDLTTLDAISPQQREEIGRVLERVVEQFEPRLRDVRATLVEGGEGKMRSLRFRIDARLRVEPAPEVAFETVLELASGLSAVRRADS